MKAMKLRDVEDITHIREMTYAEAIKISGPGFGCKQQSIALSLMTWRNTREDWLRLQACLVILKHQRRKRK